MKKTPTVPRGLSPKSRGIWRDLTREYGFESHELGQLEAALRWQDRSEDLIADVEGANADDRARLVKLAMDAASTSLRFWRALKFYDPARPARRPGRPSGDQWSAQRKAQIKAAS
jgi:hypothetical protein